MPESIPELYKFPESKEYFTHYMRRDLPFVLRCNECNQFPAIELWKDEKYLRKQMGEKKVTVAVTPYERASPIEDDRFMVPEERTMLFDQFFDEYYLSDLREVHYLQKQNNLIEEFSPLVNDVVPHVRWATELFGNPLAANIWMGDYRSVSSMRKNHYENIYCVICGPQHFIIYPPVSLSWMPYEKFKKFQWYFKKEDDGKGGKWDMKDLNEEVEWILPSCEPHTAGQLILCHNTQSYVADLFPGDALYLPALWYYRVLNTQKSIAVNYLYDKKLYDMKFRTLELLTKLCNLPPSRKNASVDRQTELEKSLYNDLKPKKVIIPWRI